MIFKSETKMKLAKIIKEKTFLYDVIFYQIIVKFLKISYVPL